MKTESGSFETTKAKVAALAVDAFKDHVLKQEGDGRWLCRRPGTSQYWFRIIAAPRGLVVFGDSTDGILRISDDDAVAWLRGAIYSTGYVLGKLSSDIRDAYYAFYLEDAVAILKERSAECEEESELGDELKEIIEQIEDDTLDSWETVSSAVCSSHWDDGAESIACACHPSVCALWLIEELKTFVRLLGAGAEVAA